MISSSLTHKDTEELVSSIQAMRRREVDYLTGDYLHHQPFSCQEDSVDVECRSKMCQWCVQLVDHCHFSRETAAIAMNLLDRFMDARPQTLLDRKSYQLAAIACLYTTVKVHEQQAISPETMASLSRGAYSSRDIQDMERTVLQATRWLIHPPTASTFTHYFSALLVGCMDDNAMNTLLELTALQTDMSIHDYDLCMWNPSYISYAAIMNSLESMVVPESVQQKVDCILSAAAHIDRQSMIIQDVQIRLYQDLLLDSVVMPTCMSSVATVKCNSLCSGEIPRPLSPRSIQVSAGCMTH